jgi:ribosomal protein S18 acetylase RimI-like enzyme
MPSLVDHDTAAVFLAALTGSDGWATPHTFQTLDDRKSGKRDLTRIIHASLGALAPMLTRLNDAGAGIFVTVNATNGRGRTSADITALRSLFSDEDGPRTTALQLPPSIVVRSARGNHVYWLLAPGQKLEAFTAAQKQLAKVYNSDSTVCDLPRVMRLPGFAHQKATPVPVTLQELHPDRRYTIEEVMAAHPVRKIARRAARPAVDLTTLDAAGQLDALSRYVGWVMTRSPAPGRRNITAFQVAAEGYRRGIPERLIEQMVHDFCAQAGIPGEADSVLRSAEKYAARRSP